MKNKKNVYEQVTDRIVAGLQEKGMTWFRPWNAGQMSERPINNATGKAYKGLNVLFLCIEQMDKGYDHSEWLTYKQCAAQGGQVRKGEKGTPVVFWSIKFKAIHDGSGDVKYFTKLSDIPGGDWKYQKTFMPRVWNVFNICQCDDIEPKRERVEPSGEFSPIESAERVYMEQYPEDKRPTLKHGGGSAFYVPSKHHVQMPKPETFVTNDDYYKTFFHELVHSTGHEDCLNRAGVSKVAASGSDSYSKEELVAEIGSQFLVSLTGIEPKDDKENSQAYINHWIKQLKDQPKMALSAATQAMKAVDFITGE